MSEKFMAAAASHWFWCTERNPPRMISPRKAAAMAVTETAATTNRGMSNPVAWKAKKQSMRVTRKGNPPEHLGEQQRQHP